MNDHSNFFNDLLHTIEAHTNGERRTDARTNTAHISAREIWTKAPKAAARKATADGVTSICVDETNNRFFIYQISGYTPEKGLFWALLDEAGRITETNAGGNT